MSNLPGDPEAAPGQPQAAGQPEASGHAEGRVRGIARASVVLATGTFLSRLLGFVSALVLAATLGTQNSGVNTFSLANQLPNNIYILIAGGLLSAFLVPQIVRAGIHADGGQGFINRLVTLGVVVFLVVAALATLAAPLIVRLYASLGDGFDSSELALATAFAYWCLPQILFYALYSLIGEVLNARNIFGPFTWAPVLNNVVMICGMLAFALMFGTAPAHDDPDSWTTGMIALVGGSATLGVTVQAVILMFFWRRTGFKYRPDFRWRGVGFGETGRAAGWVFGMILVNQLAGVVEMNVVARAGDDDPSFAVLRFAWLIFMLPHSILALSIITPYFTRISAHARDGDLPAVRTDVSSSLRSILLVMVFAAVGLIVLAFPFSALFSRTFDETMGMGLVVIAYLLGLIQFSVLFVIQRTFYAINDTRTPFFMQVVQAVLFTAGALLAAQLPEHLIAAGIATVTTIAGTVQALLAVFLLRRRIGGIGGRPVLRHFARYLLAVIPAFGIGAALLLAIGGLSEDGFAVSGKIPAAASMAMIGSAMAVAYFGILLAVRDQDLTSVVGKLRRRMRRAS